MQQLEQQRIPSMKTLKATTNSPIAALGTKINPANPIAELLRTDEYHAKVINKALAAMPRKKISWIDLHRFLELSLKLKGYLDEKQKTQTNIALVIQK